MDLDIKILNDAYISLAEDFIEELKKERPRDEIKILKKKCEFQKYIVLSINGKEFSFDLLNYLNGQGIKKLNSIINSEVTNE